MGEVVSLRLLGLRIQRWVVADVFDTTLVFSEFSPHYILKYSYNMYEQMAQQAVSYFDKSFALTSRLSVSLAFSKKDGPPPTTEYRPWSKHSAGSSRNQKLQEKLQQDSSQE